MQWLIFLLKWGSSSSSSFFPREKLQVPIRRVIAWRRLLRICLTLFQEIRINNQLIINENFIFHLQDCLSLRTVSPCLCQHSSWWNSISTREMTKTQESVASMSIIQSWIKLIQATLNNSIGDILLLTVTPLLSRVSPCHRGPASLLRLLLQQSGIFSPTRGNVVANCTEICPFQQKYNSGNNW